MTSSARSHGTASQTASAKIDDAANVARCALTESRRALTRWPAPIAGETSDVAAIESPMPIETVKNRIELP